MNLRSSTLGQRYRIQSPKILKTVPKLEYDTSDYSFSNESESQSTITSNSSYDSYDSLNENDQTDSGEEFLTDLDNLELSWEKAEEFVVSDKIPQFRRRNELKEDLSAITDIDGFFSRILTDDFLRNVCLWTNQNAEVKRNRRRRESHERKWEPISTEKLKSFLSLLLLMPLVSKPKMKDYWSNKALTETPGLKQILPRDEFLQIKRYVQFYNSQGYDKNDTFYKVRPLIQEILLNTNALYAPPKCLTLDETMIAFKGRCKFIVYMPLKPIRYGFKAFTGTPSEEPIVLNLSIYDGKGQDLVTLAGNMLESFKSKGHVVYMDRFYTSPKVFKYLEEKGFGACGTILHNRLQLTEEMKVEIESLEKNQYLYYKSHDLLLSIWKDTNKTVTSLSTVHKVKQVRVIRRNKKNDIASTGKIQRTCNIPSAIADYIQFGRGVDIFNQYTSYNMFSNRSTKWYFRIIVFSLKRLV